VAGFVELSESRLKVISKPEQIRALFASKSSTAGRALREHFSSIRSNHATYSAQLGCVEDALVLHQPEGEGDNSKASTLGMTVFVSGSSLMPCTGALAMAMLDAMPSYVTSWHYKIKCPPTHL
jgi:hypothetical protein